MNFYTKIILNALLKIKHVIRTLKTHDALIFFSQSFQAVFKPPLPSVQGLSDFHKMIVTVQKYTLVKAKPKVIQYRCYKHFESSSFRDELKEKLSITREYDDFEKHIRQFQTTMLL